MSSIQSKSARRTWVVINYLALITLIVFWFSGGEHRKETLNLIIALSSLAIVLATFYAVYIRTGLWKMVHTSFDNLDEREVSVVYNGLRYSYSILAILCVLIFMGLSVFDYRFDIIGTIGILYLAHIFPASIIAWQEREV